MLQIKHVSKTFNKGTVNEKQALRDLNLTLKEGDFVTDIAFVFFFCESFGYR